MKNLFFIILLFTLGSCATRSIYYWGNYEEVLKDQFQSPGKSSPQDQVLKLEEDIEQARSENKPLPPGFYAHLGYQYLQMGKTADANKSFLKEKKQFPESAVLMDRFIQKPKTKAISK
jgi:hypothetical protein